MDSLITAAARALAAGDPFGALNRVALRDDAPALALRGIALAQLGDLARARGLVRRAAHAFGAREPVARARCVLAEAEIALAARDLGWPGRVLEQARVVLERHGDAANAARARYLGVQHLLLTGRIGDAEAALGALDLARLPPALRASCYLVLAGIALRRVRTGEARRALARAGRAAREARIQALVAEVETAAQMLRLPAARLLSRDGERAVRLEEVEALRNEDVLLVDACRLVVRRCATEISLARRPVLFALARALAESWPADATRERLVAQAFGGRRADESHRARLRVEIGRLRRLVRSLAAIRATPAGFALQPRGTGDMAVLAPPVDGPHAAVLACLADGEAWSSSALALALGASQRTVQRALDTLAAAGRVQPCGRGRTRRWVAAPIPGFATTLLLSLTPPVG